jgi:uncharacterized membrane protein YeaQ/YmgE (transglycosylase-associated protein family)
MGLIATIVIGALAGWIAGQLLRGSGYGFWLNLGLGIVGSIIGGWLGSLILGVDLVSGFNLTTLVTSVVGAVVVVLVYRLITRRSLT